MEAPEYWTLEEASAYSKYSVRTLRTAAAKRKLTTVQTVRGGQHRTTRAWVDAWMTGTQIAPLNQPRAKRTKAEQVAA